ncbi:hypothetical protein Bbelb_208380 [Branchiostoma belcheri]|nr:hypothetical protein Bbelb_208380 [Branchiostoma belcheri]
MPTAAKWPHEVLETSLVLPDVRRRTYSRVSSDIHDDIRLPGLKIDEEENIDKHGTANPGSLRPCPSPVVSKGEGLSLAKAKPGGNPLTSDQGKFNVLHYRRRARGNRERFRFNAFLTNIRLAHCPAIMTGVPGSGTPGVFTAHRHFQAIPVTHSEHGLPTTPNLPQIMVGNKMRLAIGRLAKPIVSKCLKHSGVDGSVRGLEKGWGLVGSWLGVSRQWLCGGLRITFDSGLGWFVVGERS